MGKVTDINSSRAQRRQAAKAAAAPAAESAVATALSPEETAAAFPAPQFKATDFKGALLTNDRLIIYTKADHRTGKNHKYVAFFRGPMLVGVFLEDAVLEEDIEGVIVDAPQAEA